MARGSGVAGERRAARGRRAASKSGSAHERGSVTAEFAIAMPAVALVLACCLSGIQIAAQQLRLQDAAAVAARAAARDGDPAVALRLVPGASVSRFTNGDLVCVRLTVASSALVGTIARLTLAASSCAPGGGR